jgi:hypothetical protein
MTLLVWYLVISFLAGLLGSQPIPSSLVNPATNDAPLEFNMNKNKAPMAIPGEVCHHALLHGKPIRLYLYFY